MKVWIVWERYFKSFDIMAEESASIAKVCNSEELAYCCVEELKQKQEDPDIDYYYEQFEVIESI